MTDIIYAKTGLRSYEQCKDEGYSGTDELDSYYCLDEEEDNEEEEEDEDEEEQYLPKKVRPCMSVPSIV